ncbi:MAG: hypothetical protein EXS08_10070 [Planctomycetes bacterium]|nr:hypothetical protein [Planctomycetota bacterium]
MAPRPLVPSSSGSAGGRSGGLTTGNGSVGKRDSGPVVGYDRGPTRRVELPRPSGPAPSKPSGPATGKGGSGKGAASSEKPQGSRTVSVPNWRDVRHSNPDLANDIRTTSRVARRAHDVAGGAAAGSIGGVQPGDYRGGLGLDDNWVCDPCGSNNWSCNSGWNWGASWCWWSYPFYWSCYYPCWYWYSYPYYAYDYGLYPATTVVYAEPQVIYVNGAQPAQESVGEGVVSAPPSAAPAPQAAPPAESPLAIAAQRYLELGDRAFRGGRYYDAVQFYAKAVEFAPDQGALYLVLADALFAAGDYHYGAYAVRRALELDPALVDSRVDKHGFYPDPKLFDEQLETLERYLAANPSDRDARLVLALNYLLGAKPKEAQRTLEAALPTMSEDAAAQRVLERARANAQGQ